MADAERGDGRGARPLTRPVPERLTIGSKLFATVLLGGADGHADELEDGMRRTLDGLERAAEGH